MLLICISFEKNETVLKIKERVLNIEKLAIHETFLNIYKSFHLFASDAVVLRLMIGL